MIVITLPQIIHLYRYDLLLIYVQCTIHPQAKNIKANICRFANLCCIEISSKIGKIFYLSAAVHRKIGIFKLGFLLYISYIFSGNMKYATYFRPESLLWKWNNYWIVRVTSDQIKFVLTYVYGYISRNREYYFKFFESIKIRAHLLPIVLRQRSGLLQILYMHL